MPGQPGPTGPAGNTGPRGQPGGVGPPGMQVGPDEVWVFFLLYFLLNNNDNTLISPKEDIRNINILSSGLIHVGIW